MASWLAFEDNTINNNDSWCNCSCKNNYHNKNERNNSNNSNDNNKNDNDNDSDNDNDDGNKRNNHYNKKILIIINNIIIFGEWGRTGSCHSLPRQVGHSRPPESVVATLASASNPTTTPARVTAQAGYCSVEPWSVSSGGTTNNNTTSPLKKNILGIKEFLKRFVILRGAVPSL